MALEWRPGFDPEIRSNHEQVQPIASSKKKAAGRVAALSDDKQKFKALSDYQNPASAGRQVARVESDLIERGLLAKTASDHSRRDGSRRNGKIRSEFGINLAPLIARVAEIQAAARRAAFEKEEADQLRSRINKLFGDIRRLRIEGAMEVAEAILPNRRPSTVQNFQRLKQVAEALEAVWEDFSAENSMGKMSHQCDISPTPNTSKENINKTCTADRRNRTKPVRTTPGQVALLASEPLREIIELYWRVLDQSGALSWQSIHLAAKDRAGQLGLRSGVWRRQCEMLGEERTALCLMIADRNSERLDGYRVRDAAAAFVGMARSEARQGAVINSLLGEMIGSLGGQRHGA